MIFMEIFLRKFNSFFSTPYNTKYSEENSYLPDGEVKPDQGGVSSSVRPSHCTSLGLTSAIATSVVTRPYNFW